MYFPEDIHEFLEGYSFIDKKEEYTNGAKLIPLFRVEQALEHYCQSKVGEWIPVEERLPEDNQAVLTCRNKHISILIWKSERRIWLEPKGNWWWSYCTVEKWQPLPEPFKGD